MKKEKGINVEMYRVMSGAPFVKVDYLDSEVQVHTGVMLLDSGSEVNILSCELAVDVTTLDKVEGKMTGIVGATGEKIEAENVLFSFILGGSHYQEEFCFTNQKLPEIKGGLPFIGILGNVFMMDNELVIDYSDFTVHTSHTNPDRFSISDCDFFFPMSIGMKYYRLPVLCMRQNGKEIVALADSGASDNGISIQSLNDRGFCGEYQEEIVSMSGLSGAIQTAMISMDFDLLNIKEDKEEEVSHQGCFHVCPQPFYIPSEKQVDGNGDRIQPIDAIISSAFMEQQQWILDFGNGFIYKRKRECA